MIEIARKNIIQPLYKELISLSGAPEFTPGF